LRDNRLTNVQYGADSRKVSYAYDSVGRVVSRSTQNGTLTRTTTYNYLAGNSALTNATTPLVSSITQYGMNFSYTYDAVGNITSETRNGLTTTYSYDNLGQLIRVNDPHDTTSGSAGTTWAYAYDLGGNITSKKRYAYTTGTLGTVLQTISYGYTDSNWKDKLTSYDGMDISYDAIGNITGYNGMMFVWGAGRRLSACMADSMILFGYNSQGERIRKFAAGVATLYTMHGKLLTHLTKGSDYMHFYYDANSRPAMVDYNGTHYTYLYNLQGDVVGLVDSTNSIVVEYKYDAWGKLLSTTGTLASTLGYLNPFRYRCYIYDEETGLYYLHSRYYNPEWGRFVSADAVLGKVGEIGSHNLFSYCKNIPIPCADWNGKEAAGAIAAGVAGGALDGPLPFGDIIGVLLYWLISSWISTSIPDVQTNSRSRQDDNDETYIYRSATGTAKSLTPRENKDENGLSFFTTQPSSGKYFRTTIEAVNSTGVLVAIPDPINPSHILINPVIPTTMEGWIKSRDTANENPHPYTILLMTLAK